MATLVAAGAGVVAAQAGRLGGAAAAVAIDPDDIGGVVTGQNGPEAGVWVIAETTDLPTKLRKIVVTDDQGRYVLPDLPNANYQVWVRGYGLVDSRPVQSRRGQQLALTATPAPNAIAAAHYYPGNYWLSLLNIPNANEFPMRVPASPNAARGQGVGGAPAAAQGDRTLANQGEWVFSLKRGCQACHQMGVQATREIPKNIGTFPTTAAAWDRLVRSGQTGAGMANAVYALGGRDRGLALFADWVDRIAGGEVPQAPPRPSGRERNVVLTLWDYGSDRAFVHDIIASNKRNPTQNAFGPIYGPDWSAGALDVLDPTEHRRSQIPVPMKVEADRAKLRTWSPQQNEAPSPFWGEEIVWNDPVNPNQPHMDREGRVWFNSQQRADQPAWCKTGSNNPYAKNFPLDQLAKGLAAYDPKTRQFDLIDLCFSGQHGIFADDPEQTMYFSFGQGIGWFNTALWRKTKNDEQAQGWCPAVIDYNGDGRITAGWTQPNEPPDPTKDRAVNGPPGYGVAYNQADGSAWYVAGVFAGPAGAVPGKILRLSRGNNPPATCVMEVYEPPFGAGVQDAGYFPQGIDVDTNGVVWVGLAGSVHLASFDRSKCKVLNGPTATGQHCREGWTLYPVPGPTFKGTDVRSDYYYYNQVDLHNALGLGPNTPLLNGTGSDSIIAFDQSTRQFVTMRVPYPLGFYTRGMDFRIDDANRGWKGRGLWAANNNRVVWLTEGGKGTPSLMAHFQVRPDPLAK
jgi:hypothetical protein